MGGLTKDLFKYIVKESTKSVIVISDSDDEEMSVTTVIPTVPTPKRSNKRKRERTLPGNANDPIALLSDSDEEAGIMSKSRSVACNTLENNIVVKDINAANDIKAAVNTNVAVNTNAMVNTNAAVEGKAMNVANVINDIKYIHDTNIMNDTTDMDDVSDVNVDGLEDINNFAQEIKSTFDNVFGGPQIQQQQVKNEAVDIEYMSRSSHTVANGDMSYLTHMMEEDYLSDDGIDFDLLISTSEITLSPPLSPLSDITVSDISQRQAINLDSVVNITFFL